MLSDNLKLIRKGKVREIYDLEENLLLVASDRISAFDVIMNQTVPDKGKILNKIALYWFSNSSHIIDNHIVESDFSKYPDALKIFQNELEGRSVIVRKTEPLPVEFIVRGYIAGSGWKSYKKNQSINDLKLPEGLIEFEKLPEPIFTPSTKESSGHDRPINYDEYIEILGKDTADKLREISIELYNFAHQKLLKSGLILADTKFEFGRLPSGEIILIDEALTPDSSRLWLASNYQPGKRQSQFDKQILRDYLDSLNWNKQAPPPDLPDNIVQNTLSSYKKAYLLITGTEWK